MSYNYIDWARYQNLPTHERTVLIELAHMQRNGTCFPSIPYLAYLCQMCENKCRSVLKSLVDHKLISRVLRKSAGGLISSYLFTLHLEIRIPHDLNHVIGQKLEESWSKIKHHLEKYEEARAAEEEEEVIHTPSPGAGHPFMPCRSPLHPVQGNIQSNIQSNIIKKRLVKTKKISVNTPIPEDFIWDDTHLELVNKLGFRGDLEMELEKFRNYCLMNNKRWANWRAAGRNWLINAHKFAAKDEASTKPMSGADAFTRYLGDSFSNARKKQAGINSGVTYEN